MNRPASGTRVYSRFISHTDKKGGIIMAYKDKQRAYDYNNKFIKESYDRVNLTMPKGRKIILQNAAKASGCKSLNEFINKAIDAYIESQGIELLAPTQDTDTSESED